VDQAVAHQWQFKVRGRIIPIAQVAKILSSEAREKQAFRNIIAERAADVVKKGPQDLFGLLDKEFSSTGFVKDLDMEDLHAKASFLGPTAPTMPKPAHVRYNRREASSDM